jgi:hypothetical protein
VDEVLSPGESQIGSLAFLKAFGGHVIGSTARQMRESAPPSLSAV